MSVTRRKFGKTKDGEPVTLYTITNKMGNSVSIMDYGATVQSINIVAPRVKLSTAVSVTIQLQNTKNTQTSWGPVSAAWATASAEAVFL